MILYAAFPGPPPLASGKFNILRIFLVHKHKNNNREMERSKFCSSYQEEEDGYIEMELSTSTHISSPSSSSKSSSSSSPSKKSREFEFQMSSVGADEKESATPCPADELFYKGKLLPLHLPPRLQMVQKLLLQANFDTKNHQAKAIGGEQQQQQWNNSFSTSSSSSTVPLITTTSFSTTSAPPTNSSTSTPWPPLESCTISPAESCRASCELNPDHDQYLFQWSAELSGFIDHHHHHHHHPKKSSWSKKFRHSTLSQKLKASRAYLKSLFIKSAAACPANAKAAEAGEPGPRNINVSKGKEFRSKYIKVGMRIPFGNFDKQLMDHVDVDSSFVGPRRSFSGAIKRQQHGGGGGTGTGTGTGAAKRISSSSSSTSSSSSSFPTKSNGFYHELNFLKRSSSANPEIENAIEGAIAHCNKSHQEQQQLCSMKT
ncbi:hypothetical protein Dimus_034567 [Dionaea muscipula]